MLFFYFLAALSEAPGWMMVWAVLGMFLSDRPTRYFILPAVAAFVHNPQLGVFIVVATWVYLALTSMEEAAKRHAKRQADEALAMQAAQAGKPGV